MCQTRWLKWILPVGIAATSLILWKDLIDAAQSIRYLYLTIFGAVAMVYMWIGCQKQVKEVLTTILSWRNPLFTSIIIWLAVTLVSLTVALQKSEGYIEATRVVFFLLTFTWVSTCVKINTKNTVYISIGFCLIGFILSLIGLNDFFKALPNITPGNSYYEMGNMGNRNLLAIMITLCLPFHFIVFENFKSPLIRIGLFLNLLLGMAVVGLTSSRVGWLGLIAFVAICFVILLLPIFKGSFEKRVLRKLIPAIIASIIVLAAPVYFLLIKNPAASATTLQRIKSFYDFNSEKNIHTESINERLQIWRNSLLLIKEHPFIGVGAGNWKFHYAEKGLPVRAQKGSVVFLQPHNDFLWVFSETGIIGGLAFLSLFLITIVVSIQSIYKSKISAVHLTVLTGVILYAVHSLFDFPKERPLILFTFACLLAMSNVVVGAKRENAPTTKSAGIILVTFLAIAFFTAWFWGIRMQGELNLKKAIALRQAGNYNGVKEYLDHINSTFFESDLNGTPLDWYRSEIAYYKKDIPSFKKYSESTLKLNPCQLYNLYNLGSIYYREGDLKTAIYYWEKTVGMAPRFTDAVVNLSAAYYNQKNYEHAAELLAQPEINFQNKTYATIVITVLGKYINMLSDTISNPLLKEGLRELSVNSERVRKLQTEMAAKTRSPREAAILEVISVSEAEHKMNPEDAERLKSIYQLKP